MVIHDNHIDAFLLQQRDRRYCSDASVDSDEYGDATGDPFLSNACRQTIAVMRAMRQAHERFSSRAAEVPHHLSRSGDAVAIVVTENAYLLPIVGCFVRALYGPSEVGWGWDAHHFSILLYAPLACDLRGDLRAVRVTKRRER
jgi:hypothetical protein